MSKERIKSYAIFVLVFIVTIMLLSTTVIAETNSSSSGVQKAYDCLEDIIKDKTASSLSLQEAIFSMLAIGGKTVLKDKIEAEKNSGAYCWPKDKCKIKETAQVGLAFKRGGGDENKVIDWLYTKNGTSNDLIWYLEIDISNHEASECTIRYDGAEKKIKILDDMTLSGNPGSCFVISGSGYFLQFKESCFQKDIEVSCNKDFITTLVYTKKSGSTLYVLPDTHAAASLGTTSEKVNVQCFKNDGKCDYEGTLWATLLLKAKNEDIEPFLPYLVALAEDNIEYFPESFLYGFTGGDDQYSKIIQKQREGRTWKMIGTPYNEFYDTSLALMALSESDTANTRSYLLSIQTASGCWNNNNVRDTAFLLYAGWPKSISGGGPPSPNNQCTSVATQSCELYTDCIDAGGLSLENFGGCSPLKTCCSIKVDQQTCTQKQGTLCNDNQRCEGTATESVEEAICCLGTCENIVPPVEDTCTPAGNSCQSYCGEGEEESFEYTCSDSGNVCCAPKPKGNYAWLIILLVILIIIVILAIVYRDKLRFYWYKYKGRASSEPVVKPGMPPSDHSPTAPQQPQQRAINNAPPQQRMMPGQMRRAPPQQRSRDFEDTLKKLRDMSK